MVISRLSSSVDWTGDSRDWGRARTIRQLLIQDPFGLSSSVPVIFISLISGRWWMCPWKGANQLQWWLCRNLYAIRRMCVEWTLAWMHRRLPESSLIFRAWCDLWCIFKHHPPPLLVHHSNTFYYFSRVRLAFSLASWALPLDRPSSPCQHISPPP